MADLDNVENGEHLCIVCPALRPTDKPRVYEREFVCEGCRARLATTLDALPGHHADLAVAFPRTPGSQNVRIMRATPQGSEPLDWTAWDLALPANQATRELYARGLLGIDPDQIGDLSTATILETWVRDWIDVRDMAEHLPPVDVSSLCRWLGDRLEWACDHHPAVDEFADEVVSLDRQVSSAARIDHVRGEYVGRCPTMTRDDVPCGTALRVDPYVDEIQCPRCGTKWNRRKGDWLKLRSAQLAIVEAERAKTEEAADVA